MKIEIPIMFKRVRSELNLTQEALSKETGIKRSSISKYETGAVDPQLKTFFRLYEFAKSNNINLLQ